MSSQAASAPTPNRWVVATAAVLMQLGLGAVYAWSIFRVPLSEHYGTGITAVNWAFFITILMIGFAAFAGGQLAGRWAPHRWCARRRAVRDRRCPGLLRPG